MKANSHAHDLSPAHHAHAFGHSGNDRRQRALLAVTLLTVVTMMAELAAGWWSGSLALTADGWHMGTHALALGGAVLAYRLSARAALHHAFAFGGWKVEVLTAYTSALALGAVALWLGVEAVQRLRAPVEVNYAEAAAVAAIGLAVNLISAWLLVRAGHEHSHGFGPTHSPGHEHAHAHAHSHGHGHDAAHSHAPAPHHGHGHGHDHNYQAAYLHVLADALTSLLALAALAGGAGWGWRWLDPAVALVGAAVIGRWAYTSLRGSAAVLVDATTDPAMARRVRDALQSDGDAQVADLHLWQVGPAAYSAAIALVADTPLPPEIYRRRLGAITELRHATIEVHRCSAQAGP